MQMLRKLFGLKQESEYRYGHVSSTGRASLDAKALLGDQKVRDTIRALRSKPLPTAERKIA